jgi:hypothetical protein
MKTESPSILDRFNQSESEDAVYQQDGDYKAFGVSRHAVSLNCISRTGKQCGVSWSLYSDVTYVPEEGVVVEFSHKVVTIKGEHLLSLYQFILGNRVTFVAEADRATAKLNSQNDEPVVSMLIVEDRRDS